MWGLDFSLALASFRGQSYMWSTLQQLSVIVLIEYLTGPISALVRSLILCGIDQDLEALSFKSSYCIDRFYPF
jgi:hypothetical protein